MAREGGMERKRFISVYISVCFILFFLVGFNLSCQKETSEETRVETAPLVEPEIDCTKIENLIGIKFRILRTKSIGYLPLYKFC